MKERDLAFIAWQEPDTKDWHVVGMLEKRLKGYSFCYTEGAQKSDKFIPFSGMENIEETYVSSTLFPLFKNRLLSHNRPEYPDFIGWLGLSDKEATPMNILRRSGGHRGTDNLQIFKRITTDSDGNFEYFFFAHSLRYLAKSALDRVSNLANGEKLLLCLDTQNEHDKNAVIIRANDPAEVVGYCPRYLTKHITEILRIDHSNVSVFVEVVSSTAPANYQLMCKLVGKLNTTQQEKLMIEKEFNPISSEGRTTLTALSN